MTIPFMNVRAQNDSIKQELDDAIQGVLASGQFIGGPERDAFEEDFAAYCTTKECAACGNGTDALYLSLRALGVEGGDEVITVANTFIATTEAITMAGAVPRFVDVDEGTLLIDVSKIEAAITDRAKGIIAVHLNGNLCDMDPINALAEKHGLFVIEDAAQAHGAEYKGRRTGTLGRIACFSFYPGKNLGAFGDAGAAVSDDEALIGKIRQLCNHGRQSKYFHEMEGVNSRMDALQAAILRVKLRHLPKWNERRRQVAAWYEEELVDLNGVSTVHVRPDTLAAYHLYPIRLNDRDAVMEKLRNEGIGVGIHYPVPLHEQPAYDYLGLEPESLPVTHRAAKELLSLPMDPCLTREQVAFVCEQLRISVSS